MYDSLEPHGHELANVIQAVVRKEIRSAWYSKDKTEVSDLMLDFQPK
ncbi:MAG: hypothetical protein AAF267_16845 [Deinococcota bacterium]